MKTEAKIVDLAGRKHGVWMPWCQNDLSYGKTFGKGGICSPLCVVFLRLQATGEGHFNTYVTSTSGQEDVMNLKSQQHGNSTKQFAMSYLKNFGVTHAYTRDGDKGSDIVNLLGMKGFYLLGISDLDSKGKYLSPSEIANMKIQGHALAVVNHNGVYMFFDPNYGAGNFRTANDMTSFVSTYWRHVYKKYLGHPVLERYFKR